jgi:hypothetical protein
VAGFDGAGAGAGRASLRVATDVPNHPWSTVVVFVPLSTFTISPPARLATVICSPPTLSDTFAAGPE